MTGKRKKTDADYREASRIEWYGSLYLKDRKPAIPGEMIEAAFIEAAKKSKRGPQAKAGALSPGIYPIEYEGPKDPDEMWKDERFRLIAGVRVQRNRVMRTRPLFKQWSATIEIEYLPDQLNAAEVDEIVNTMGRVVGLGDWRPRYGRFEAMRADA